MDKCQERENDLELPTEPLTGFVCPNELVLRGLDSPTPALIDFIDPNEALVEIVFRSRKRRMNEETDDGKLFIRQAEADTP